MEFTRADYAGELTSMRLSRRAEARAVADNFAFEENVGPQRLQDFENFRSRSTKLRDVASEYFFLSVQGIRRTHIPSTFRDINRPALLPPAIARAQKIVRLERIDTALLESKLDFGDLAKANLGTKDVTVLAPFVRALNRYSGARPAFASFKAEVDADLREPDWLELFRARTGLGHHSFKSAEVGHFALMEYSVEEVFRTSAAIPQPFAVPTVLESQNSEFFFPAPAGASEGYAVHLYGDAARSVVREFLHARMTYTEKHIAKLGRIVGPTSPVGLASVRDLHLNSVRRRTGNTGYGSFMTGEVDD